MKNIQLRETLNAMPFGASGPQMKRDMSTLRWNRSSLYSRRR